jgi:prevent-host-death family protein
MKSVSLARAKATLSEIVTGAEYRGERVIIEKRKTPAVVLIGYEEYRKLEALEDERDAKLLEDAMKTDTFHGLEEVARRLGLEL